jgi:hypothetical protein
MLFRETATQETGLVRKQQTFPAAVPGAGTLFALRAIGIIFLVRWLSSMSQVGYISVLTSIASSPWACLNIIFLFLLVVLPGSRPKAEKPFHPLPRWLRQSLRGLAVISFAFAAWTIGGFALGAGAARTLAAIARTNGWLVAAPLLYLAIVWICRPRAAWRTNIAARRFALGRFAIALDAATQTATVWDESRKLGQYGTTELSLQPVGATEPSSVAAAQGAPEPVHAATPGSRRARDNRVELLWHSAAAAGHNRRRVLRVRLYREADRLAAEALRKALENEREREREQGAAPTGLAA